MHIATISDETAGLSMEMTVEMGKGYVLPDDQERTKTPIGVIPIGAAFTPVTKANYIIEPTRVGHKTDYERLVIEIWTNGTITASDALSEAARILDRNIRHFMDFNGGAGASYYEEEALYGGDSEVKAPEARIEELDFSVRTYNCLKKANIVSIGELVQISEQDLMNIRNFGRKSLNEVIDKLAQLGLSLKSSGADYEPEGDNVESEDIDEVEGEKPVAKMAEAEE